MNLCKPESSQDDSEQLRESEVDQLQTAHRVKGAILQRFEFGSVFPALLGLQRSEHHAKLVQVLDAHERASQEVARVVLGRISKQLAFINYLIIIHIITNSAPPSQLGSSASPYRRARHQVTPPSSSQHPLASSQLKVEWLKVHVAWCLTAPVVGDLDSAHLPSNRSAPRLHECPRIHNLFDPYAISNHVSGLRCLPITWRRDARKGEGQMFTAASTLFSEIKLERLFVFS